MFARTERLLLRPGWREDAGALHHALNDGAVLRGLGRDDGELALADVEALLGAPPHDALRPAVLAFARTFGAPRLVGGVALEDGDDGVTPALSLWIARPYWGLGFATEAGAAMIDFARASLRLPRLVAYPPEGGLAAARVLAKLGFVRGADGHRLDFVSEDAALAA